MKKLFTLFMSCLLLLAPMTTASADDIYDYTWSEYTDSWSIASVYDNGRTVAGNSWQLYYVGYPAAQTGESELWQFQPTDDKIKTSGILSVSAEQLEEALTLSLSDYAPVSPAIRIPLKQGEYVRLYLRGEYQKYTLLQSGTRSGTARPVAGNEAPTQLTDIPCGVRPYEILIPLLPQLKIEHYNHLEDPLYKKGIRTEIYTCIGVNGGYACTASYVRPYEVFSEDGEAEI